ERSLKSWVIESISSSLSQVVDPKLLSTIGREDLKASYERDCYKVKEDQSDVIKGYGTSLMKRQLLNLTKINVSFAF
ncbi:hypothetical protein Goshw_013197, partial [Gossypium schwendimanii]|nr:hypothetical protein [Gossypium schwendimanii]